MYGVGQVLNIFSWRILAEKRKGLFEKENQESAVSAVTSNFGNMAKIASRLRSSFDLESKTRNVVATRRSHESVQHRRSLPPRRSAFWLTLLVR